MWSPSCELGCECAAYRYVLCVFFPVSLTAADRTLTELTERRFAAFILYN